MERYTYYIFDDILRLMVWDFGQDLVMMTYLTSYRSYISVSFHIYVAMHLFDAVAALDV